jgi:hypothetical protein
MIVEMLVMSCAISTALNFYLLAKTHLDDASQIDPTVKVVVDSLESDPDWFFSRTKEKTVPTYRNDPLGISFTLVACAELNGDIGGGLVKPSYHVFTKHERALVLAAVKRLEVKALNEKRSALLDKQIRLLESGK